MENDKIKSIKEHVLREAETVIEEYVYNGTNENKLEKENKKLKKKIKKQRIVLFFLIVLLIIAVIVK